MSTTVKLLIGSDVRRVVLNLEALNPFQELLNNAMQRLPGASLTFQYLDDEEELVTVSSTPELLEAIAVAKGQNKLLKLQVFNDDSISSDDDDFVAISLPVDPAKEPRVDTVKDANAKELLANCSDSVHSLSSSFMSSDDDESAEQPKSENDQDQSANDNKSADAPRVLLSASAVEQLSRMQAPTITRTIQIPCHTVGVLIGRGGETIRGIQVESGVRIAIARETAGDERTVTFEGTESAIELALKRVEDVLDTQARKPPTPPAHVPQLSPADCEELVRLSSDDASTTTEPVQTGAGSDCEIVVNTLYSTHQPEEEKVDLDKLSSDLDKHCEIQDEPDAKSEPPAAPAPASAPEFPPISELVVLLHSFLNDKRIRQELMEIVVPTVREGVCDGLSVEDIMQQVVSATTAIAEHPLRAIVRNPVVFSEARRIIDWDKNMFVMYTDVAEHLLTSADADKELISLEELTVIAKLIRQALATGTHLDLDVFSTPKPCESKAQAGPVRHKGVACDGCGMKPIVGDRFKCTRCPNFDLCEACEANSIHPPEHILMKFKRPQSTRHFGPVRGMYEAGRVIYKAKFIQDESVPDQVVYPSGGIEVRKTWRVKNTGFRIWPKSLTLFHRSGSIVKSANGKLVVPALRPGEEGEVMIDVLIPNEPGSHVGDFRLQTRKGNKFGQRLWVRATVQKPPAAREFMQELRPASPNPEEALTVSQTGALHTLYGMGFSLDTNPNLILKVIEYDGDVNRVVGDLI